MMKRMLQIPMIFGFLFLLLGVLLGLTGAPMATPMQAATLPGTASLSGTVSAPTPFKAAQVYIRNLDKRMLYMVYTSGGRYQAVNLFPGNYQITVVAKGLESNMEKVTLEAGQSAKVDLSMLDTSKDPSRRPEVEYLSFDEIYPPGPGLAVAQRTCISCHGASFLPSKRWSAGQWNGAIDMMSAGEDSQGAQIQPKDMNEQDRKNLVEYLVKNFGPDSRNRAVKVDIEMPVDEAKISKAMYIEYYLQPDAPGQGSKAPEYNSLPGVFSKRRVGQDVRFDSEGNVWLTDRGYPHRLVKLNPRTGDTKDYLMYDPTGGTHDLNIDKEGIVWVPEHSGTKPSVPKYLNGFNPKTEKWELRYPLDPDNVLAFRQKWAQSLTIDSKGNIYVGWISGSGLSRWDRETKKTTVYPLPTPFGSAYGVIADKTDNIWVAEWHASKFAKLDGKTFKWTEYTPPTYPGIVRRLNVDSKNNIWVALYSAGKLVKLDQTTDKMTEYLIPHQNSQPYDVAEHAGNIWIADAGQGGTLIKFTPQDQTFTYYPSPQRADKPKIQITREGAIWYSPRSSVDYPGFGVLYPDMEKMTTLAARY